jgi:hypothetical protein
MRHDVARFLVGLENEEIGNIVDGEGHTTSAAVHWVGIPNRIRMPNSNS